MTATSITVGYRIHWNYQLASPTHFTWIFKSHWNSDMKSNDKTEPNDVNGCCLSFLVSLICRDLPHEDAYEYLMSSSWRLRICLLLLLRLLIWFFFLFWLVAWYYSRGHPRSAAITRQKNATQAISIATRCPHHHLHHHQIIYTNLFELNISSNCTEMNISCLKRLRYCDSSSNFIG